MTSAEKRSDQGRLKMANKEVTQRQSRFSAMNKVKYVLAFASIVLAALGILFAALGENSVSESNKFDLFGVYRLGEQLAGDSSINMVDNRHYVFRPEFYYMFVTDRDDMKGVPSISGRAQYNEKTISPTEWSDLGFTDSEIHTKKTLSNESAQKYTIASTETDHSDKLYMVDGDLWIYFAYGQVPVMYQLEKVPDSILEEITGLSYDEGLSAKEAEYRAGVR